MTRQEAQGYAQDLIALSETQQSKPPTSPKPPAPGPIRTPAKPPRR
ncbi:hypothetical protein [Sphaerisporangium fuscum]|nr:hypothetical protein [Sphaerisporangium fuscum]